MNKKNINSRYRVFILMLLLTGISGYSQAPKPPPIPIDKSLAPGDWSWLSDAGIPVDRMTRTLKQIPQLPAKEAKKMASQLRAAWEKASQEGKHAACLLIAAALEQAGEKRENRLALITYRKIKKESKGLPYAKSADFRLRLMDKPGLAKPEKLESLYKDILRQGDGWFFVPEIKTWITPYEAAQYLLQPHGKELSFRFFNLLRSNSPFPPAYSYLFILLVLTFGIKILELPLYVKVMKNSVKMRGILPEIEHIRLTAPDASDAQKQTNELLRSRGINPASGCAVFIVDIIFLFWAFYTLVDFSPQFTLDGARFLWTQDIMQRSMGVLIAWVAISVIHNLLSEQSRAYASPGALAFSSFLGGTIVAVVAWFVKWPAYVFIFWILLTTAGILLNLVFHVVHRIRRY